MFDRLEFILSEALLSLRRNGLMTFAAVTTSGMALFILGGFLFAYLGVSQLAASAEQRFEMTVFVKSGLKAEQLEALGTRLKALPGVASISFRSKDAVWADFKKRDPGITQGLDINNPMPDEYTIRFKSVEDAMKIAEAARRMPEVDPNDGVNFLGEEQKLIQGSLSALRWLGLATGAAMLLTGGILIYNTVKLTMEARRREIRIMQLVGATKAMVWTPLLIEGALQGIMGGWLATGILWLAFSGVTGLLKTYLPFVAPGPFPVQATLLVMSLAGALYGVGCSYWAIRERKKEALPR